MQSLESMIDPIICEPLLFYSPTAEKDLMTIKEHFLFSSISEGNLTTLGDKNQSQTKGFQQKFQPH